MVALDGYGTHPLAGVYTSKADFLAHTFDRLARLLKEGSVVMQVTHAMVDGDRAAVELEALSTALNGKPFNNHYCRVTRFTGDRIVEVRAWTRPPCSSCSMRMRSRLGPDRAHFPHCASPTRTSIACSHQHRLNWWAAAEEGRTQPMSDCGSTRPLLRRASPALKET